MLSGLGNDGRRSFDYAQDDKKPEKNTRRMN